MMSTKKSIPLIYLLRVTRGDCWIIHWMLLGSQVFKVSLSITKENIEMGPSLLKYSFVLDDVLEMVNL